MGKRVLSMVLTLCMVLMLVPATAAAAGDTGRCDHEWDDTPWPQIGRCRICNAPRLEPLDHEHTYVNSAMVIVEQPTCTENGVQIRICGTPGCYYALGTYTAFKLLHKYKSIEPSRAATCTEPFYVGAAVCER